MTDPIPSAMYQELNREIARQNDTITQLTDLNYDLRKQVITLDWQVKDLQRQLKEAGKCQ